MFGRYLIISLWILSLGIAPGCPWCQNNPAMKPTVNEGDPDPGGKYFGQIPDPAKVRRYYIAAEPVLWDYLPAGEDPVMKTPLPPQMATGVKAAKFRYQQYADEGFQKKVFPPGRLGILGPVMRGQTGDFIVVTLLNRLPTPVSMHPHGVRYDKDSEGSSYFPGRGMGASIGPGAKFTYVWHLDEASGPRPDEPSSKPWLYHSHVIGDSEINAGLSGFIIVTDPARSRPDGTPKDVDREMALLFQNYDESGVDESAEYAAGGSSEEKSEGLTPLPWEKLKEKRELNMRHAINGRIFGNLRGLEMRAGERVRWYVFALGNEADVHTAHWHGARLTDDTGRMMDVLNLMPGNMKCADMLADNPGEWMIHCHVGEHMMAGMYGTYQVFPADGPVPAEDAFFGLSTNTQSVRWLAADGDLDPASFQLKVRCLVTAYENLSVWTTKLGVTIGRTSANVQLDQKGAGESGGGAFRVVNADSLGLVRGDALEIELRLTGSEWKNAIRESLVREGDPYVPLEISLNGVAHQTRVPLTITGDKVVLRK
ncbi:MAG: multicopper oxidase domain-containing protein [Luteolibacter sp.]|uniref:multicopper oxidase domain-containing protein n=1 Tax=Luteolibacter sp. TaxID=1962973 RepID=UPI0032673943